MYTDEEVEKIWNGMEDIPFDENIKGVLTISRGYHVFAKGEDRESIWYWFDENHSKGVVYLLNKYIPEH